MFGKLTKKWSFQINQRFIEGFALGFFSIITCFFVGKFLITGPGEGLKGFIEGFISGLGTVLTVFLIIRLLSRKLSKKDEKNK